MKIIYQKIPVTLTRKGNEVELSMKEDKMEIIREELLGDNTQEIVTIATKLGDENQRNITLVKGTLLRKEDTSETFIIRKILAE